MALMGIDRQAMALKEARQGIGGDNLTNVRPTHIIAPVVTRRPAIDQMLGDMAIISQIALERMRNKVLDDKFLDKEEKREFKDICETVLRQTRVEMEVEDHVAKKTAGLSASQIDDQIVHALKSAGVAESVTLLVREALGTLPPKHKS